MNATKPNAQVEHRCPGCGRYFTTARGLLSHQTAKFVAMGCKR